MDYSRDAVLIQDIYKSRILEKEAQAAGVADNNTNSIHLNAQVVADILSNFSLNENDTEEFRYVPYYERPETYIVPVLFAIIFIIGTLGNGTLIAIFIKHRNMRNVPNMYICSLAVGDILVILFCVPFTSTVYTVESWPYGLLVCKFSEFIKDVSIGVSVFTLTALSADRYFAIADPMRKLSGRRATRITCVTIVGIWVMSVVIALPSGLFSHIKIIDTDPQRMFQVCYPFPPSLGSRYPQIMVMCKFLVYYGVPLLFIATFYIIMARHLVLSTKNMPGEAQGTLKQIQARKKVAKMVLSFVVIFALCFFPSHVFLLWFYFVEDSEYNYNEFWHVLRILGFCLGFINSCINPITLYCVSGTFRKHFNHHLFCCLCDIDGHVRGRRRGVARGLMGCGCVSISNTGPLFLDGQRPGNGRLHGLFRASTTNSAGGKRKNTWETQHSTISHHQLLMCNLNAGTAANSAHIRALNNPLPPLGNSNNCFPLTCHIQHQHNYQKNHLNLPQVLVTNCVDTHCEKSDSTAPPETAPLAKEESMADST